MRGWLLRRRAAASPRRVLIGLLFIMLIYVYRTSLPNKVWTSGGQLVDHLLIKFGMISAPILPEQARLYMRSAWRVSDDQIRLTLVSHVKSKREIKFRFGSNEGLLTTICNRPTCVEDYTPKCTFVGLIGTAKLLNVDDDDDFIDLESNDRFDESASRIRMRVPVIDRRPPIDGGYEHTLAVCVQPMVLMADWPVLLQFFEAWIEQGATKFYIYRNSHTPEIQAILDLYSRTSNASIELIDWSYLPWSAGNGSSEADDPNYLTFWLEVSIAIFDCLHRARYIAKFTSHTDFDELIHVHPSRGGLIAYLEDRARSQPLASSFSFRSRRAKAPPGFDAIHTPLEADFDAFSILAAEDYYFPRPYYTKFVHRPERVARGHIHKLMGVEPAPSSKKYHEYRVPQNHAYVLHLRRFISSTYGSHPFSNITSLGTQAKKWSQALKDRLHDYELPWRAWRNGYEMLEVVEKCNAVMIKNRKKRCASIFQCDRGFNASDWYRAANTWTII